MPRQDDAPPIRTATADDASDLGRMFTEFNQEFGDDTPPVEDATRRVAEHIERGHSIFLIAGEGPDGFAQIRLRPSIYVEGLEAYLQELYVVPELRGQGIGRALLEAAMGRAREAGAEYMDLGTSEDDTGARALYESAGFTNREGGPDGPVMYVYERDL